MEIRQDVVNQLVGFWKQNKTKNIKAISSCKDNEAGKIKGITQIVSFDKDDIVGTTWTRLEAPLLHGSRRLQLRHFLLEHNSDIFLPLTAAPAIILQLRSKKVARYENQITSTRHFT